MHLLGSKNIFFFNSEKNTFLFRLGIAGYNQDEFTFIICHNLH